MAERAARLVVVGQVLGAYGVQGWVKVHSALEPPEEMVRYPSWMMRRDAEWRPVMVLDGRRHGKAIVARLAGCEDRDAARALAGAEIAVQRDQLPRLGPNEFYWDDLIGLTVITVDGVGLGVVDHLLETGANDVLVVRGERERLIPYHYGRVITDIDLARGVMTVDWDPDF